MQPTPMIRRSLTIAGATLILSGSALGLANAQSQPTQGTQSTQPPQGQATPGQARPQGSADHQQQEQAFLAALAKRLGISTDQLQQAMTAARTDLGLPPDRGIGPGGPSGGRRGGLGPNLDTAAQFLGISTDQLRQELSGSTLAAVAQAHGKSAADLATALKNAANQRIDQEVSSGRLSADQANQRKQDASQRIDQMLNQQVPAGAPSPANRPAPSGTPRATS